MVRYFFMIERIGSIITEQSAFIPLQRRLRTATVVAAGSRNYGHMGEAYGQAFSGHEFGPSPIFICRNPLLHERLTVPLACGRKKETGIFWCYVEPVSSWSVAAAKPRGCGNATARVGQRR